MKRIFELGSKAIMISAFTMFVGSIITGLYGVYLLGDLLYTLYNDLSNLTGNTVSANVILIVDVHLLSVIQYVMAVGLYELFIGELTLPAWLKIKSIDQLKAKLASVIILILAVKFTEKAIEWKNSLEILYLGISIAIIIGVLTFYYRTKEDREEK